MRKQRQISICLVVSVLLGMPVFLVDPASARQPASPKFQSHTDDLVNSMRQKAEGGMVDAQMVMAKWCFEGGVIPKDHAEATRWYEMAAKQGNVEAMMALGRLLIEGDGIPKDVRKGCEWYVAAARKGNAEAYFELGRIFEEGDGVPADLEKALKLYEEADKRGETNAASRLASIGFADPKVEEQASMPDWDLQEQATTVNDDWGFSEESGGTEAVDQGTTVSGTSDAEREKARQYDLELRRRAEQEWNEFARLNGGPQFVGEPGSGQLAPAPQNDSGWDSGQSEETVFAYAQGIAELVGVAAGFESQIDPMIETIRRHQQTAKYSTDWNEQRYSMHQAEVWIGTLDGVMDQYKVALGQLFSLYIRDGAIFRDAMRMLAETPECHPTVRNFCREFIGGSISAPSDAPYRPTGEGSMSPSFQDQGPVLRPGMRIGGLPVTQQEISNGSAREAMYQGWLEAIEAGQ